MTELYIFSQDDKPLTIITEDTGLVSAPVRIEVNSVPDTPFSFTVEADNENAQYVKEENKVVYRDHEGDLRLVVIKELDDSDSIDGPLTTAICEPEFMELTEHIVVDRRIIEGTAQKALDAVLEGTRYIGEVEVDLGLATTNFYYIDSVESIWKIIKTWGGEFKDVVEFDDKNNIIARKIKLLQRLGKDHGQRFEIDHNITEINRTVLSYPLTAMYGRGASLEIEDEEGNHTGGYTRYIDFADVEWKKSKGDPVDKPKGQLWVGDPEALQVYGRPHNGGKLHRYGIFSNQDYEDPEELLWATWQNLQENKRPEVNYQLSVDLFNDKVSLGDTAVAIDRYFSRPIEIQARVIAMEYDLLDIDGTMIVEMGQFLNLEDNRLDEIERDVENLKNRRPSNRVTEGSYPDVKPGTPVNLRAEGGIEIIQLYWDYDSSIYVKQYEVYGSQVKDFIPDSQHLLWRGDVSAFAHTVGTDQVWYYRVRAINYHGTASEYSVQVSASTHRVISDDILFGEDLAEKLRELSKVSDLLADDTISFDKISEEAKKLIDQQARQYTDAEIQATENRLLDDLANKAGLAYVDGQLQLKADADTVSAVQRDIDNLETKANDLRANVSNIVTDLSDLRTSVNTDIAGLNNTASKLLKRVADNEDALKANGGKITSIEREVDTVKGSLSTTINQLSSIDGVVSEHTVAINANTEAIKFKASQDSVDTLTGQISAVEGSIETLAGKVSLKAEAKDVYTKSEVNTALGKKVDTTTYDKKMSSLDVSINGITADVKSVKSEVSSVDSRLEKAQAQLDVLPEQISAKAEKSSVYTKTETDGRISNEISSAKAEIKVTTDGISQEVSSVRADLDGLEIGGRNLLRNSDFRNGLEYYDSWNNTQSLEDDEEYGKVLKLEMNNSSNFTSNRIGQYYTKKFTDGDIYTVSFTAKGNGRINSIKLGNAGSSSYTITTGSKNITLESSSEWKRYSIQLEIKNSSNADSSLLLRFGITDETFIANIKLEKGNKATDWQPAPEDVDGAISNVQSYASSIDQKADSIQSSVSSLQSTVNSHGSKISSAETKIAQNTTAIGLRAIKTDVDAALNGKVNVTNYNNKIGELTTSINGISGRVTNTEASVNDLTDVVNSAKSQIASLDVRADGIVQSVSEVRANLGNIQTENLFVLQNGYKSRETNEESKVSPTSFWITGSWGGYSEFIPMQEGQDFIISAWIKRRTKSATDVVFHPINYEGNKSTRTSSPTRQFDLTDEWTYVEFPYTAVKGTKFIQLYLRVSPSVSSESAWINGLMIQYGTIASPWKHPGATADRVVSAESSITQLANEIDLKVDVDGIVSSLNLSKEGLRVKGSLIELDGTTLIRDGIIGTAAIANAAITKAKLGTAVVGTAQIENGAITNAKIANATIDDAKIANVSVTKLKAGEIDTSKIKIRGGSSIDYTLIDGSLLESRGRFTRTWRSRTKTHDIKLRFENGYLRARNDTENGSLYFSDYGISTQVDGNADGMGSSGTLEFFTSEYSSAGASGVTLSSYGGVVGLRSELNRIVLDSEQSVNLESRNAPVYIRPRINAVAGSNVFNFTVTDSQGADGYLYYGSEVNGYGIGLRFSKSRDYKTIWLTDGNGERWGTTKLSAGYLESHILQSVTGNFLYIGSSMETRSVSASAYQSGSISYIDHRARFVYADALDINGGTNLYIRPKSNGEAIVTSTGSTSNFRPIRARAFNTDTSLRKKKKDIKPYEEDTLNTFRNARIYTYHRLNDTPDTKLQLGLMLDEMPSVVYSEMNDSFDLYALTSYVAKGLKDTISYVDDEISWLKTENQLLKNEVSILENKIKILEEKVA